jgi:hypothetical protein
MVALATGNECPMSLTPISAGGWAAPDRVLAVAGQLIVRMRRFGLGLAFNCENKDGRILKLTAFEKRLSISELGL